MQKYFIGLLIHSNVITFYVIILLLISCSPKLPGKSLYAIEVLRNMDTEVNQVFTGRYSTEKYLSLWNGIERLTAFDLKRKGSKKLLEQDRKIQLMIVTFRTVHYNQNILPLTDQAEFRDYMKEIISVRMRSEYK